MHPICCRFCFLQGAWNIWNIYSLLHQRITVKLYETGKRVYIHWKWFVKPRNEARERKNPPGDFEWIRTTYMVNLINYNTNRPYESSLPLPPKMYYMNLLCNRTYYYPSLSPRCELLDVSWTFNKYEKCKPSKSQSFTGQPTSPTWKSDQLSRVADNH
jgi:hypothetical protein